MSKSTRSLSRSKTAADERPDKPYPDFPLFPHRNGRWARKCKGKFFYFGKWADDPTGDAAFAKWQAGEHSYRKGHLPPPPAPDGYTVKDLCNLFRAHKKQLRDAGRLSPRTFHDYQKATDAIVDVFGRDRVVEHLTPDDFRELLTHLSKGHGLVYLRNAMVRVRSVFKFAVTEGKIPKAVTFGQAFKLPTPEELERKRNEHKATHGDRMLEAVELRAIIKAADQPMRAMVLLAANTGYGQSDLSALPIRAVNLETGWIRFPRPKTGADRKTPLWPETIAAIKEWLPKRPAPKDPADAGLMFLTKFGQRWVKLNANGTPADALGQEFVKVVEGLGLKRPRVSFYAIRHGFETIGGETLDQVAVDFLMGHRARGMAGKYRERIGDDRLQKVVDHVRQWLDPAEALKVEGGAV